METIEQPENDDYRRVIGYYFQPGPDDGGYGPDDVPYDSITHLKVSSLEAEPDGTVVLQNDFQDTLLREFSAHVDGGGFSLTVIGGYWFDDPDLSMAASTRETRERFAETAVDHVVEYGFDGIDIDWEYPDGTDNEEDPGNFTLLLEACRRELDERVGPAAELTYPGAHSPSIVDDAYELDRHADCVDYISVMTYDYHGPFSDQTNFNAPLFAAPEDPTADRERSTHQTMEHWMETPIPNHKLLVGIPFYGRNFSGVDDENRGLFTEFEEGGAIPYTDIDETTAESFWHRDARVPWQYRPDDREVVSSVDAASVMNKCAYAMANGFGGVFCWQLRQDEDNTLIGEIYEYIDRGQPNPRFTYHDPVVSIVDVTVRESPGRGSAEIDTVPEGSTGLIVGGPIEKDGVSWYAVAYAGHDKTGWTKGSELDESRFIRGDLATTRTALGVYDGPGFDRERIDTVLEEATGEVVDGPVASNAYRWWRVAWGDGTETGWSPEGEEWLVWTY